MNIFVYISLILLSILPHGIVPMVDLVNPNAKEILDKVSNRYLSKKSIELDFTLNIQIGERPERIEKGHIVQVDEKFLIKTDAQHIFCDGLSLWYFIVDDNEVQINDYEGSESSEMGIVSPTDLLTQYQSGEFEYVLLDIKRRENMTVARIEFKPNDNFSDYSKLRLTIDQNEYSLLKIEAFGKEGNRYIMTVDSESFDKSYPAEYFTFNPKKYPGVYIEDLRID